jgi:cellulose synthase/poly-beta-1,6-N-acetylglucosamine synthase-like glycosyltransferase
MSAIKYSVIIPCSRPAGVQLLLDALLRQTLPAETYEIIVVVPCNAGKLPISNLNMHIVETTKLLPPGQMRNMGAKAACTDLFCFIDDDCVPPPDWLERMIRDLEADAAIGLAGCRIKGDPPTFWNRCADFSLFPDCQSRSRECFGLSSGAIAARRIAMEEVGGFDNDLTASEDWDLSVSLKSMGWKLFFNPDVEVLHRHGRGSPFAILRQAYRYGYSSGLSVQRRYPAQMTWMANISVRCSHPFVYMFWLPFAALLTGIFQIWRLRGADQLLLLFSPVILAARFSYQLGVWRRLFKDRQPD